MFGTGIRKLSPLSGKHKHEVVGIDFNGSNLKLAYARISPDRREIISLANRDIIGLSDGDISKAIRTCYDGLEARNPNIISIVPPNLVITKNIEIPSINDKEIREIINLQAGRHTPYSREEIIIDYFNIGTYKQSYTKILLVIVTRNIVKRHFEILDKASLKLERVVLAPEGLAWSVSRILKIETEDWPANIVHIDESFTDFSIVSKNKVVFIRSIPIGTQLLTAEKEKYQIKFIEELKRSLEAYQSEDIEKSPNMLILTGAIEGLKDLEGVLNNTLHLPVKAVSYFNNLVISDAALKAASLAKHLSFLNVITPVLTSGEMKINLIPEEIKLKKSLEERGRDLIKTGVLVLSGFIVLFSILASKIFFKSVYLKDLDKQYSSLNQEAERLGEDFAKISAIKNYLASRGFPLAVLTELYNISPQDMEFNDIRFDEQGKFSLRGTAESMSVVFSFVDSMEKSEYFKDVKTKYTSKRKDGVKDLADFEITSSLDRRSYQ